MSAVEIPLTQGLVAKVSLDDADLVLGRRWHAVRARHTAYAASYIEGRSVYLHRLIMRVQDAGRSVFVDHINHDGLDNRRENLRLCTPAQNAMNRRFSPVYNGRPGVYRWRGRWAARIGHGGKGIYLGTYDTERDASIAYVAAARALRGEWANTRRPQ